ncbi:DNA topoisomerase III [Staphylococcus aureus]
MTVLIIAEKPNQAKKYVEALGDKYNQKNGFIEMESEVFDKKVIVTWCIGHLIQLANMEDYDSSLKSWSKGTLPFIPEEFIFKVSDYCNKQFKVIKDLCEKLNPDSEIIIATDPDREGEAIARYVLNQIPCTENITIKRLWANTQEPDGLKVAFKNLKDANETYRFYLESEARNIADWLVGMNFTRFVTLEMKELGLDEGVFSVGRVQTPTLYMVYKRNNEIKNFTSKRYFELVAKDNENEEAFFKSKLKFDSIDELEQFLKENSLKRECEGEIKTIDVSEKRKVAPNLYKLGGIQKVANQKWGYTLDKTLSIVQRLYDKGYLSYPRTDCSLITNNEFEYLNANLSSYCKLLNINIQQKYTEPRAQYVNDSKVLEHYAIIPTKLIPNNETYSEFSEDEKKIYDEVVKRTILMFMDDYLYNESKIVLKIEGIDFKITGKIDKVLGWKTLDAENKNPNEKVLPNYELNERLSLSLIPKEVHTKPPKYLTEASLGGEGGLMENCSSFIENESLKTNLKEVHGIGTPATRSSIVKSLIDRGYLETKNKNLMITTKGMILCTALENSELVSVEMTAKWESDLKDISEKGNRNRQREFIDSIKVFIKDMLSKQNKLLKLNSNDKVIKKAIENSSICSCPRCEYGRIKKCMSKEKKTFYACGNNDCDFIIFGLIANKKISTEIVQELVEKGKTRVISGFKSKKGKEFKAKLKMTDKGVEFEFDDKK